MSIPSTNDLAPVASISIAAESDELTLEAFQEVLLQLTGRRVPALTEMVPQTDPSERN
jgi:hypothetical protein